MPEALHLSTKPANYKKPEWQEVSGVLESLRRRRQPVIDRIWQVKRVRRGQWQEVIDHIPKAYRKMLVTPDLPVVRDMLQRITGLITKNEPLVQVIPASIRPSEVSKASKEEARLHALRVCIEDQQDRSAWMMGVDAQCAWGESWLSVWPDPLAYDSPDFKRRKDEDPDEYIERYGKAQADGRIPMCIDDHDPQTVFPYWTDRNRLGVVVVETEHATLEVELGMGYKAVRNPRNGEVLEWMTHAHTLSEPWISRDRRGPDGPVDIDHAYLTPGSMSGGMSGAGGNNSDMTVKKVVWMDPWVYQVYLDGILVEEWEHDFGVVPMFPAFGEQTSDRDPGWESAGVADASISIARQVIFFSAVLASNAMHHGYPTPFLKNPASGLVHPVTGDPLTRKIVYGEMNMLAAGEEIAFPFLDAQMMPDFFKHLDWLMDQMKSSTLSDFGQALGTDIAGYAIAQIRSMQLAVLAPVYKNATRQWRKIYYFLRHLIRTVFPQGVFLRGAVEEEEKEGSAIQFRPLLRYAKDDTTDYSIDVVIEEGLPQDEIAEGKFAIELMNAGLWSPRRAMEKVGVDDPMRETDEIGIYRMANSQEADQNVLALAMDIIADRRAMMLEQQQSSLFGQALERAKQRRGLATPQQAGMPANQPSQPQNALPGGQPIQQNPPAEPPIAGPMTAGTAPNTPGPAPIGGGGMPGGVPGGQVPVGAPG